MKTIVKDVEYKGWNAVSFDTEYVELIMPKDIGPRILVAL